MRGEGPLRNVRQMDYPGGRKEIPASAANGLPYVQAEEVMNMEKTRRCVKCLEEKPLYDFPRVAWIKGGYHVKCRVCESKDRIAWKTHTVPPIDWKLWHISS